MSASFFHFNSLRSRLMLLVILAIAPTACMTVWTGYQERERAIRVAEENLQRLTNLAAANEAQSIERARQILRDLSSVPGLVGNSEHCNELLTNVLAKNPEYANFGLISLNGDVTCSAVQSARMVNLADRPHFQRAVREKRFVAGNYVFGRVIQKHTVNLTYPITDKNNEVRAVVFAALDLSALDRFVDDIQMPPGSLLLTVDAAGAVIARRPNPEQWFGRKLPSDAMRLLLRENGMPAVMKGVDGVERLHAFARVGGPDVSDYTVTIGIPSADIVAAALGDQKMELAGLAVTLALALLAAWLFGDVLIVRRVRLLMQTADKIAAGSLSTRTGIVYRDEEISNLARSLDEMAEALQRKEAEHHRAEDQLRAADQRKDEFLAMLAHELRNPLAPISTGAQLLQMKDPDTEMVQQTAGIIVRQVGHMTRLVDDLLDVSRVTRGLVVLSTETLDLRDITADAVEQARPLIEARGHQLSLHLPPEPAITRGDHKRLVQIVVNLLNNAAKYTPDGGRISLVVVPMPTEHVLTVTDNGIGMTAELATRAFELFAQAERTPDRSQGGLGLGLALVRTLVDLHGGTVEASSQGPGMGSTFTVRLPRFDTDAGARAAAAGAETGGARSRRILLVDDNIDAVHTLEMLLKREGHEVTVAYRAADAVALARATAPHVCLLDIGLPDFDGDELARRLRAMPQTAGSVLIAVTGYGREQDRIRSLAAGFDEFFVKPIELNALQAVLSRAAQRT
jgi:signal transduction histidine kinase/ActR/RegA family two-component response regulator